MIYKVVTNKAVTKFLKTCDKHIRNASFEKVLILANDPNSANNKLDISAVNLNNLTQHNKLLFCIKT